jgi:hypothetical protein
MLGMEQRYYQILTHIHSILMNRFTNAPCSVKTLIWKMPGGSVEGQ